MKRSELKQIIREVIEEAKETGPVSPTDDINVMQKRLKTVFNIKDYTETWLKYIRPFLGSGRSQFAWQFARGLGINPFDVLTKGIVKELYENDQIEKDTLSTLSKYDAEDLFKTISNYIDFDILMDQIVKLGSKIDKDEMAKRILYSAWNKDNDSYDRHLIMKYYVSDNMKKIYSNGSAVEGSKGRSSFGGPKDPNSEFRQLINQIGDEVKSNNDNEPWKNSEKTQLIENYINEVVAAGKLKRNPKRRSSY